jgi:hypothetical protein
MNRTTIAALILAVALGGGIAKAEDTGDRNAHHPSGAADSGAAGPPPAAMPMAGDDQKAPGAMPGMPGMMGNMMQMMGSMMQMMPQMCGTMMQGESGAAANGMMGGGMGGGPAMGQPMPGAGMTGHRGMARGAGGWADHEPLRHIEGHLAFYRAELAITDAQNGPWNAFADAVRKAAKALADAHQAAVPAADEGTALDQMQRRVTLLTAHLDALKQVQLAAAPLYAALSPEQKKVADDLMSEPMGRMWR